MSLLNNKFISIYRDADLEAFYDADPKYRIKIIAAHLMIHLLPVIIVVLGYLLFPDLQSMWIVLAFCAFLYVATIVETTSYLFPQSRRIYKKFLPWFIIPLFVVGGGAGYYFGVNLFESTRDMDSEPILYFGYFLVGIGWTIGVFIWAHIGLSLILGASRYLYTRKAEVEADVRFATEVQKRILDDVALSEGDCRGYACSIPANELGGDFFELSRRANEVFATVGDVSGHSFGAGLLMTMTKSALQVHFEYNNDPARIMSALNRMFLKQSDRSMYATMVMLKIDHNRQKALLCNAGHLPVLHVNGRTGEVIHRYRKGMGLGIHESAEYSNMEFPYEQGDRFILYSDGLTETRDERMEVRDPEAFEQIVRECASAASGTPKQLAEAIITKVKNDNHSGQWEDDATLIVIEVQAANLSERG
ncbi:PP2C family protein-serine/threonine phosphatase [Balneolales bacterium ANBcel1]|nr:PP2C family protein-serine/threonine phosphatase [Balneolales bacterium ANBcel1]